MIDLVGLRALLAVEAGGSVASAAQTTGYTPSAVSQQVKRLERDLGVALLERVGRGVVLTDEGRRLARHGQEALDRLEGLVTGVRDQDGPPTGTVRLAAFSTAVRGLVAPLVADAATRWPDLVVEVVERDPPEAVDLVATGQVDLALVHHWVGIALPRPDHLAGTDLGTDVADLLVHRDHRLAGATGVAPGDLLDEPWASTPVGSICHAWFTHMFAGAQRTPRVRYWSWEFASHVSLVEAGVAVALVPRLGRGRLPEDVVAVPVLDLVPTRVVSVLHRRSTAGTASVRCLTAALAQAFRAG